MYNNLRLEQILNNFFILDHICLIENTKLEKKLHFEKYCVIMLLLSA